METLDFRLVNTDFSGEFLISVQDEAVTTTNTFTTITTIRRQPYWGGKEKLFLP